MESTSISGYDHFKYYTIGKRNNAQKQNHIHNHVLPPRVRRSCAFSSLREQLNNNDILTDIVDSNEQSSAYSYNCG